MSRLHLDPFHLGSSVDLDSDHKKASFCSKQMGTHTEPHNWTVCREGETLEHSVLPSWNPLMVAQGTLKRRWTGYKESERHRGNVGVFQTPQKHHACEFRDGAACSGSVQTRTRWGFPSRGVDTVPIPDPEPVSQRQPLAKGKLASSESHCVYKLLKFKGRLLPTRRWPTQSEPNDWVCLFNCLFMCFILLCLSIFLNPDWSFVCV